jgi:hypothetical protein
MAQPKASQLRLGAKVVSPPTPGGPSVTVVQGDAITHLSGWHVCIAPPGQVVYVPIGGYPAGYSDHLVHWSQGPSYSGMGVPGTPNLTQSVDNVNSGFGTDGRAVSSDGTIGGAPGAAAGGVSGQSSGGGNVGSGGGSASRGF